MAERRAVVIGGGIGGLTAAVALHHRGWAVTVLERAERLEPVGAGIALAPNALRALDLVGLGDELRAQAAFQAAFQGEGGLRLPDGRWLSRSYSEAVARRYGGPIVIMHRADLVERLVARLPQGAVRTATTAGLLDPGGPARAARVNAADEELHADLVVAADGIHSGVRAALFPHCPGPVYAGFTSWRMVVPPPAEPYPPHETWGPGLLWGTVPLADGRGYCYATAVVPPGGIAPDGELAELRRLFGGWHRPVPALLAAADPAAVLRHDVYWLATALPAFHRGRVALLGDAAHAMTPNLGQGGCQAIEDAVVLAHRIAADAAAARGDLSASLAAYSAERLPRTTAVARRSWSVGRLTTWTARPAVALRTAAFTLAGRLGARVALRSLAGIADWRPPGG